MLMLSILALFFVAGLLLLGLACKRALLTAISRVVAVITDWPQRSNAMEPR
jgi:hypothetical protein